MKEFDKWFETDELINRLDINYTNNVCSGLTWDTVAEVSEYVWKSALEWAMGGGKDYCSFNKCVTADRIEKELEE